MGWCAVQPGKASSERAKACASEKTKSTAVFRFSSRHGAKKSTDAHEYRAVRAREPMEREVRRRRSQTSSLC